ncbi:MAG: hypothetical protein ACREP2_09140 [Rhodanobacteraceae bacterium]
MSAADQEHVAEPGQGRPDVPPGESRYASDAQFTAALKASLALLTALRHLLGALRKLVATEGRVLLAGIPLFFIAATALIAFSVSLWVCVVALIGWAFMIATHSVGVALGLLVILHLLLVGGVWLMIKYAIRQATFPQARAELRRLGRTLLHDINRVTGAVDPQQRTPPAAASNDKART